MAVHLRAIFAPGIRVVGCIPSLWRGHGRQGMQRLIVLSYVLAGTNVSSADRLVTVLEPKALIRAPTMRSAKLDRRSANREVPWTLEAPVPATCQAAFPLTHSQFRSTDCPSLQDPRPTSSISEQSERIYQSINRPISTGNPALAKQLPAVTRSQHLQRPKPQGTAVIASRSHSPIKRIEPHRPTYRPRIVPPADRIASRIEPCRIPVPCNRKPPFPIFPLFATIIISKRTALDAQSAHCPGIPADYQRTVATLRTSIRKFRLFSRPPTATSATSPRTARLSHLSKHFPRSQHPLPFPIYRQFPHFCLTMPQAPRLLVWFLTLPSQIARAALRRIGGKRPCPLTICSLVRFTETKQRRLLATKSNQKRRN